MSLNAYKSGNRQPFDSRPMAVVIEQELLAQYGTPSLLEAARMDRIDSRRVRPLERRAHRPGLEKLVRGVKEEWMPSILTKLNLPYNLAIHGPAVGYAKTYHIPDPNGEMIAAYARMGGWLRRFEEVRKHLPHLDKVITHGQSVNGVNSPYTTFSLWKLAARLRTPELANRRAKAVYVRAAQILAPYSLRPMWSAVGAVLAEGSLRTGKAAIRLAAETVRQYLHHRRAQVLPEDSIELLKLARGLREWSEVSLGMRSYCIDLIRNHGYTCLRDALYRAERDLVYDCTDGVIGWREIATQRTIAGWTSVRVWTDAGDYIGVWLVISPEGETYHSPEYWGYTQRQGRRQAFQEAKPAFERRKAAQKAGQLEFDLINQTPLVWLADSYQAGNCQAGTAAYVERKGWTHRQFVPVTWLLEDRSDHYVAAVLWVVAARIRQ